MNHSIDTDCKESWEEFLGCPLTYEEYSKVDAHLDYMILDYDTKEDFYRDFVWLNAPISISEKFREESLSGDREESMFQFLVPKDWLINEFCEGNEDSFTSFILDYTSKETREIYSNALLNNKVLFEKRKEI